MNWTRISRNVVHITVIVLFAALFLAVAATRELWLARPQPAQVPTVRLVVVQQRFGAHLPIREPERNFVLTDYPAATAPKDAVLCLDRVRGQRLNKVLDVGKPVTNQDLLSREAQRRLECGPGEQPTPITAEPWWGVGAFVRPGASVDVFWVLPGDKVAPTPIARNKNVLRVSYNTAPGGLIGEVITLAATPEEATRMALASCFGRLRVVLRGMPSP